MDTINPSPEITKVAGAPLKGSRRARWSAGFETALNPTGLKNGSKSPNGLAVIDADQELWDKINRDKLTGLLDRGGLDLMAEALRLELIEKAENAATARQAEDLNTIIEFISGSNSSLGDELLSITNTHPDLVKILVEICMNEPDVVTKLDDLRNYELGLAGALKEMEAAAAEGREKIPTERVAVVYIDLNKFSNINNTLGHEVGDEVLAGFATALRGSLREQDLVARKGGDEFVVVLPLGHYFMDVTPDDIRTMLENKLKERIGESVKSGKVNMNRASAAIGVCIGDAYDLENLDEITDKADKEMYLHKMFIERSNEKRAAIRFLESMVSTSAQTRRSND